MTRWVRLDADYFSNDKAVAAGLHGRALHVASICWNGLHEEDGLIPEAMVRRLCRDAEVPRSAVEKVVDAGLWLPLGNDYLVKNFTEKNRSRAQLEREREMWRARQAKYRSPDS